MIIMGKFEFDVAQMIICFLQCFSFCRYCDVFQKCREVDPAGPLATLRRLLLSEEAIESFRKWVSSNWFAVLLIISGVISLLVRIIAAMTLCINLIKNFFEFTDS